MYRQCVICKGITDDGIINPPICFSCVEQLEKVLADFNKLFPEYPAKLDDIVYACIHDEHCRKAALGWQ